MTEREDQGADYLMVSMAGVRCAIPAGRVLKVLRRVKLNAFPGRAPALLGLARYGSEAVAVLDGAAYFGIQDGMGGAISQPVVVMVSGGTRDVPEVFGLLVEEADRVFRGLDLEALHDGVRICDPAGPEPDKGE